MREKMSEQTIIDPSLYYYYYYVLCDRCDRINKLNTLIRIIVYYRMNQRTYNWFLYSHYKLAS